LKSGETKRAEIYLDEGDLVIETFGEDGTTSKGTITLDADGNASLSGDLTVDGDTELGEVTASGPVTIDATAPAVELAAASGNVSTVRFSINGVVRLEIQTGS